MLHHHSHAMKVVGMITWLVTAIAALLVGLEAVGIAMGKSWSFWQSEFVMNNLPALIQPAHYLIGLCGLISLITWFTCLGQCGDHRHDRK